MRCCLNDEEARSGLNPSERGPHNSSDNNATILNIPFRKSCLYNDHNEGGFTHEGQKSRLQAL